MLTIEENALNLSQAERKELAAHPLKYVQFATLNEIGDEIIPGIKAWVLMSTAVGLIAFIFSLLPIRRPEIFQLPAVLWRFIEGQFIGYMIWRNLTIFQFRKRSTLNWLVVATTWTCLAWIFSYLPIFIMPAAFFGIGLLDVVCENLNKRGYRRLKPNSGN